MKSNTLGAVPEAKFSHAHDVAAMPKRPGSIIPMPVFVQPTTPDNQIAQFSRQ